MHRIIDSLLLPDNTHSRPNLHFLNPSITYDIAKAQMILLHALLLTHLMDPLLSSSLLSVAVFLKVCGCGALAGYICKTFHLPPYSL